MRLAFVRRGYLLHDKEEVVCFIFTLEDGQKWRKEN
jgi:hypothetical protein